MKRLVLWSVAGFIAFMVFIMPVVCWVFVKWVDWWLGILGFPLYS